MENNLCACIPVRYGSQRLPGKPLLMIGNKTIIERTIDQVLKSKYITKNNLFIMTDDSRIEDVGLELGIEVIMTGSDCENALVRMSKYVRHIPKQFRWVMNIHGDEPFIDPRNIDHLVEKFEALTEPASLILHRSLTFEEAKSTSTVKIVLDRDGKVLYCSRHNIPFLRKGSYDNYYGIVGVHIFERDVLAEYHKAKDCPLSATEDIEELKIIEMGYKLKSVLVPYASECSLNTPEECQYLKEKYEQKTSLDDET